MSTMLKAAAVTVALAAGASAAEPSARALEVARINAIPNLPWRAALNERFVMLFVHSKDPPQFFFIHAYHVFISSNASLTHAALASPTRSRSRASSPTTSRR